jgi:hypothetical protein
MGLHRARAHARGLDYQAPQGADGLKEEEEEWREGAL